MNQPEIERLAAAVNALRPDWPLASLRTGIANDLGHRAYRDAAVALAWIACDPESKTPKRVLENGPWWAATQTNGELTDHPSRASRAELCHHCQRVREHCQSERVQAGDPHRFATVQDVAVETARQDRRTANRTPVREREPYDPLDAGVPCPEVHRAEIQAAIDAARAGQRAEVDTNA